MSRACSTCQHVKRAEIDRRLAAGEPSAQVARDYELNASSLHRHRTNCLKLGSSNAIMKETARGSAAVALLPSKETLSGAYFELRSRIDQIVAQATQIAQCVKIESDAQFFAHPEHRSFLFGHGNPGLGAWIQTDSSFANFDRGGPR